MKILVIGSGGREHALCWKLAQSRLVKTLYCAPGNPGTAGLAENVPIDSSDLNNLADFAAGHQIDLTVVGPEQPLALGIADFFRERGLRIFGPSRAAAQLESSKSFAKEIMCAAQVPTAAYQVFTDADSLREYTAGQALPVVLKADGLAAGKGVFVCHSAADVEAAIAQLFEKLSASGVVVEEFLGGHEVSYIVATNGSTVVPFASAQDYKRIFDGQKGPNTGGMGAVSPSPHLAREQEKYVQEAIIAPVLAELNARGIPYCGFLYAGLMLGEGGGINVLEFNVRMGDPECQAILRRMRGDLALLLMDLSRENQPAAGEGKALRWDSQTAVCVVLAAEGYPAEVKTGDEIVGIELAQSLTDAVIFHAGTAVSAKGKLLTSGGRVLSVSARGDNAEKARASAYQACDYIQFKGRQFRRDIGL